MAVRGDNSLYFSTALDNSGLQSGANDAVGIVQGLARSIAGINPFLGLALGAAAAFTAIASGAHKMMKEFESSMAEVKTIAGLTESEFAKLEKKVFGLYKELGTESASGLAKGLYDIIGAGYKASDALELLEIASKAATAGVTTSAVAADGLTTILNAFRLEASDAGEVADIMFATVDRGKISFEELSSQIAQVAPLAAASGFSFDQIGAAIATLTKQGVPASQAMTQIRSAIIAVGEVMGDGVGETMTLQNAFQALYDKAGGSQNQLKELAGRVEAVNAIISIAGPNFEGATQDLIAMGDAAGSVDKNFKIITSTSSNEWKIFGERIKASTEQLGESIVDISGGIARFMNNAIRETANVTEAVRDQANEYNILKSTLEDVNTPFDEKLRILKQLKEQYPEYLESLQLDKINNDNLEPTLRNVAGALKAINDEQQRRIKLSGINQVQAEQEQTVADYEAARERAKVNFYALVNELTELAAKNDIEVNYSLNDDIEDIYQEFFDKMYSKESNKVGQLLNLRKSISTFSGYINESNRALDDTNEKLQKATRQVYDNEGGYKEIVKQIREINSLGDLSKFGDYTYPKIKEAFDAQRDLLTTFMTIDLTENLESLEPFLKSENEKIKKYAEERYKMLNRTPTGTAPKGDGDGEPGKDPFVLMLKEREKQYKEHEAYVEQLGQEAADEEFSLLLERGANYGEFLENLLKQTTESSKKIAIAMAAATNGIRLSRPDLNFNTGMDRAGITAPTPNGPDFTLSIDYIEGKLRELNNEYNASTSNSAKEKIQQEIDFWNEKLLITQGGAKNEEGIYSNLRRGLEDLNNKQLKDYIQYWRERLKETEKGSEKEQEALDNIESAENEIANNTADTIRDISGALGEASSMFRSFGEDAIADALDKLGNLAQNMAGILTNIASGNWIGVVAGGIAAISGLISGSGSKNELSAYEKSMNRLKKSIDQLTESMSRLYGAEQLAARKKIIENLTTQEQDIKDEIARAEKWIADRGGLNPFTLPVILRLNRLKEDLTDVQNQIYDANEDLRNAATGTTQDSIADAIIQGFKDGKKGIEDFADTFEDTMREAMLHTFKQNFLQKELQRFYDQFAEFNSDGLTNAEISSLEDLYNQVILGAGESIEALNEILQNAGFDPIGLDGTDSRPQGLSGAITNITEDTANILEGYLNAIRLDVRQGTELAIVNSGYLLRIANNTDRLAAIERGVFSMDGRMATVERGIQEFQAQG